MKTLHTTKLLLYMFIVLICGTMGIFAQQSTGCVKGPEHMFCEDCKPAGVNIPWGNSELYTIPFILRNGTPTCSLQVCVKKRTCNGEPQMKILGVKALGCTEDFSSPLLLQKQVLQFVMMQTFVDNSFGLFPNPVSLNPTTWYPVTIYMSCCYGKYRAPSSVPIYYIPCSIKACCVRKFKVNITPCGVIGAGWDERCHSDEYGGGPGYDDNGYPKCMECGYGANTPYEEMVPVMTELVGCFGNAVIPFFDKNDHPSENGCGYACPTNWTGDFTVKNGIIEYLP